MSYQNELRMISKADENILERIESLRKEYIQALAKKTMEDIKSKLFKSISDRDYNATNNDITVVCVQELPEMYLHKRRQRNLRQIPEKDKKHFLLKERSLTYSERCDYDIKPEKKDEFKIYKQQVREIAERDGITVDFYLYEPKHNRYYSVPCIIENTLIDSNAKLVAMASVTFSKRS